MGQPIPLNRHLAPAAAIVVLTTIVLAHAVVMTTAGEGIDPLRAGPVIPLPGVTGRIDHLALDIAGQRLFVAALGNNTVEVVDLRTRRRDRQLTGFREPQGLAWVAPHDRLVVANGGTGEVDVVDGRTYNITARIALESDADNVRFDPGAGRVFVGYGGGAIAVLDAAAATRVGDVALGAHPESFQLAGRDRLLVNVPDRRELVIIDRIRGAVVKRVPIASASANYPLAIDETHRRVFVGCRRPAVLLVFDLDSGAQVASVPIDGDTDDLFYDAATRQVYVVCGAGWVDILAQQTPDQYTRVARIATASGARTGWFSPEFRRLFVAVPHRARQGAEIRTFDPS